MHKVAVSDVDVHSFKQWIWSRSTGTWNSVWLFMALPREKDQAAAGKIEVYVD